MAVPNSNAGQLACQAPFLQAKAVNWSDLAEWMGVCSHSQTMTAYDLDLETSLVYALPCNQWSCRHCAVRKTKSLAHKTLAARPNRLGTLTIDPKLYSNPRHAFDQTRRKVPEWVRSMRKRCGDVEYLRVTEITKAGWPHYHLLIRSPYLPHEVCRDEWALLTGATIVDVRQVKKLFNCYTYLLKYLTKMHKIEWTGRHVSYSRNFFPPNEQPEYEPRRLELRMVHNVHPATFMMEEHPDELVTQLSPRTYRVGEDTPLTDRITEDELHLSYHDPWVETPDQRRLAESHARQEFMSWIEAEEKDIGVGPDGKKRHGRRLPSS